MLWGCGGPTAVVPPTEGTDGPIDVPTDPPTEVPASVRVFERSAPICADPGARSSERFVAHELPARAPPSQRYLWGAGIVASDFDGDGTSELIAVHETELEYLAWDGSRWAARAGLPALTLQRGFGAVAADLDADGDRDVFITQMRGTNHLLINDGTGTFTESTPAVLRGTETHHSASTTVADFDGDGDLDLFVAGHGYVDELGRDPTQFEPADPSQLWLQTDAGWEDASDRLPANSHDRYTFVGGAQDLDDDGDLDLLMVNDFGRLFGSGQLLWNTPAGFVADDNAAGLDLNVAGMGLAWADLNEDRVPDLLMPYWAGYKFMLSGGASWFDYSNASGLRPAVASGQEVGWGANFGDLDNDGVLDAVVMHGWLDTAITPNGFDQPDGFFQGREGGFSNVTGDWDLVDPGDHRGLVLADLNGDGWLDLARPSLDGPTVVYMANCGSESWLEVDLRQPGPNPEAIGAHVRAFTADAMLTRYVLAGGEGLGSGGPAEVHFGLGAATSVDLEITWPDGHVDEVPAVPTDRRIRVERIAPPG